jgi:membrane associated rhomboid family serine protease
VPGKGRFVPKDPSNWLRLFTHVAGHANWSHLISNFTFILLLGPILEESYGSLALFLMILITALVTGALNVLFFPSNLLGASGVVFMMIVLSSFTNFRAGEIPLTFILILVLYLGREIASSFDLTGLWGNHISEFAHIAGGFCGSLFGFFSTTKT